MKSLKQLDKQQAVAAPCGCVNQIDGEIVFCSLHAAAPALLAALKVARRNLLALQGEPKLGIFREGIASPLRMIDAAIAKAEAKGKRLGA